MDLSRWVENAMYDEMVTIENIEEVYQQVRLRTHHREKIVRFELFYSANILQIYEVLKQRKYQHSFYHIFLIRMPKYRVVMSENISDKIINHLVSSKVLLPILEPKLVPFNVATRKEKGVKMGLHYVKKYINKLKENHDNFYILKCDIKKYFYNIDHEILIQKLERYILDEDVMKLLKNIICMTNHEETNRKLQILIDQEKEHVRSLHIPDFFLKLQELDEIPRYQKGKGLPIGNLTSQIFAIFYLNDLDHFIKEKLHIKYYVRYMDDFLLFHPDKKYLKYCLLEIEKKVSEVKLELNRKTRIYSMKEGFPFLGYSFHLKGKKLILRINPQTKRRIVKKLNHLDKVKPANLSAVKASYYGYLSHCHSGAFLHRHGWYE